MTHPDGAGFIVDTARLTLRPLTPEDAPFIFDLVNDSDWIRFIGDRGVRDIEGARQYIINGPMASYVEHGFGLYCVTTRADATPVGICGLIQRDSLPAPDLGFAFLPAFRGAGYAAEAAAAMVRLAREISGARQLFAVVQPDNTRSLQLLERLGFRPAGSTRLVAEGPDLLLLSVALPA